MNYYYDLQLNFSEDNLMFYEWDKNDGIEYYKKIPMFLVSSKTLKDFIGNNIKVNKQFLNLIKGKAICKRCSDYVALFVDKNGAIALEFDDNGISIARSLLDVSQELDLLEVLYTYKVEHVDYEIVEIVSYNNNLKLEDKIKLVLTTEITYLLKINDYSKLKYLYMEWFNKIPKNNEEIKRAITKQLGKKIGDNEIKIFNLIKLSYSRV